MTYNVFSGTLNGLNQSINRSTKEAIQTIHHFMWTAADAVKITVLDKNLVGFGGGGLYPLTPDRWLWPYRLVLPHSPWVTMRVCIIKPHRSIDAAYCYQPSSVVCWSVTLVSPAKTAEPIEMPFGLRTRVGPGNHVLDGGPDPPWNGQFWGGKAASHCKV